MKKGFAANLEEETRKNTDFRRVLYTGKHSQLVLMCLKPKEDIGEETHDDVDQFFRFEEGEGVVVIDATRHTVKDGSGVIVPSGAKHKCNQHITGQISQIVHNLLPARAYGQSSTEDKAGSHCQRRAFRWETHRKIVIIRNYHSLFSTRILAVLYSVQNSVQKSCRIERGT